MCARTNKKRFQIEFHATLEERYVNRKASGEAEIRKIYIAGFANISSCNLETQR